MNINKYHLKTYILIVIISLLILLSFSIFKRQMLEIQKKEVQTYLEEIRDNSIFILNYEINRFTELLESEAHNISNMDNFNDEKLFNEIHNFAKQFSLTRVNLISVEGKAYTSYFDKVINYNPDDYASSVYNQKKRISSPRFSNSLQMEVVDVIVPIFINNKYFGILIGTYSIEEFESLLGDTFMKGECYLNLASSDGSLLVYKTTSKKPKDLNENIIDFYFRDDVKFFIGSAQKVKYDLSNGKKGFVAYNYKGLTRLVSYAPVGINDWYLASISSGQSLTNQISSINKSALQLVLSIVATIFIGATLLFIENIKRQKQINEYLKIISTIDSLTGLLNRHAFEQSVQNHITNNTFKNNHAFFMIDIDGFKQVNDKFGHKKGDELLQLFASSLQNIFKDDEILGRMGGDEFMVFIPHYETINTLKDKAQNICSALKSYDEAIIYVNKINTSASVGISIFPDNGLTFNELYYYADIALYNSKNTGRNKYSFYDK